MRTIVALGEAMDLDIVADDIGNEQQLRTLRTVGCGCVQGYLLGRPAPAAEVTLALERLQINRPAHATDARMPDTP